MMNGKILLCLGLSLIAVSLSYGQTALKYPRYPIVVKCNERSEEIIKLRKKILQGLAINRSHDCLYEIQSCGDWRFGKLFLLCKKKKEEIGEIVIIEVAAKDQSKAEILKFGYAERSVKTIAVTGEYEDFLKVVSDVIIGQRVLADNDIDVHLEDYTCCRVRSSTEYLPEAEIVCRIDTDFSGLFFDLLKDLEKKANVTKSSLSYHFDPDRVAQMRRILTEINSYGINDKKLYKMVEK